ncbi:TetR/AcrR family transcriptional regulator, partial [Amycolatopsis sp. NPDC059021]|uniref:TetR/AcrR family transcriptional regulator n=1 Tax=Amycolatopsis sp. NPDC059021 TaxID=3346704 RepID=UPI00366D2206
MSERQKAILDAAVRVIAHTGVRGLRVEKLAAEADISTALIYYHFGNRAGLLRRALEHINDRAAAYTQHPATEATDPRDELEQLLLLEIQDTEAVRTNSTAWGELRASAVFTDDLREPLAEGGPVGGGGGGGARAAGGTGPGGTRAPPTPESGTHHTRRET